LILEGEFVAKWVYVLLVVMVWILLATLLIAFVHELINYAIITHYGAKAIVHFGFFKLPCASLAYNPFACHYTYTIAYTQIVSYNNISNRAYNQMMYYIGWNENIVVQFFEGFIISLILFIILFKLLDMI
jgi:hypothetical protein